MDYSQDDINALAAKLGASALSQGERAVVSALVDAAEGEVTGFGAGLSFAPLKPAEFSASGTGNLTGTASFQDGDDLFLHKDTTLGGASTGGGTNV